MRWRIQPPKLEPKDGDRRVIRKFAFMPKKCDDSKYYVWLEHYTETWVFDAKAIKGGFNTKFYYGKWRLVSREADVFYAEDCL
jgi:hypothetical protein